MLKTSRGERNNCTYQKKIEKKKEKIIFGSGMGKNNYFFVYKFSALECNFFIFK
jgi:hypothetical protein